MHREGSKDLNGSTFGLLDGMTLGFGPTLGSL